MCWHYLSSQAASRQVLSAQRSLTTVFGMGTGGPFLQSTPTILRRAVNPSIYSNRKRIEDQSGDPYGIRTRVAAVRGRSLRPLDQRAMCIKTQMS